MIFCYWILIQCKAVIIVLFSKIHISRFISASESFEDSIHWIGLPIKNNCEEILLAELSCICALCMKISIISNYLQFEFCNSKLGNFKLVDFKHSYFKLGNFKFGNFKLDIFIHLK